jgi:2-oxo-3-hexenedioate decarboxylase
VQDVLVDRRVRDGAERLVGVKLGLTSEAKQRRMGIDAPLTAWLTDAMLLGHDAPVPVAALIHPRLEPEIVFEMARPLEGPGVTLDQALAAVGRVRAGFEVIDSRYTDFSFALPDVVADNASASVFVLGADTVSPDDLDLVAEQCTFQVDGETVATATGADVQGHPAQALALAANELAARGRRIEAGWLVLTGGLTDAVPIAAGSTYTATFTSLGTVRVQGT